MAVNGKNKGASFERTVAKLFSDALGVKLRRTPMSGGWSHGNPETAGDLVSIEGEFPYCVECKCEEGWHLETLFTGNHKWFDNWWKQTIRECPDGKIPILVFNRARQPIFAAVLYSDDWPGLCTSQMIIMHDDVAINICLLNDLLAVLKR
jgi:hypothetical protein